MSNADRQRDVDGDFAKALEAQYEELIADQTAGSASESVNTSDDHRVRSAVEVLRLLEKHAVKESNLGEAHAETQVDPSTRKSVTPRRGIGRPSEKTIERILPNLERLGRFEIIEQIGRGGFGIVVRAGDPRLDRDVAIKIPRLESALSPESRQRFEREAKAAASLNHPNIVGVYESGSENGIHYIVTELVEGENLATCLARGQHFEPRDAAKLLVSLADAVDHAHQRGVLHRDLKPSNVLMSDVDSKQPKITDFGLAAIVDQQDFTQTGAVVGTPMYMSPEQATGNKSQFGPPTDVYGLGTILYQLLTRRAPFAEQPLLDVLRAIENRDPIPPQEINAEIPRDLAAICTRCLEKNPRLRYESARDLQMDLQRFLDGQAVMARPVTSLDRFMRLVKRNPLISGLSFALLVGLVGGLIALAILWQGSEQNRLVAENNEQKYIRKTEQLTSAINRLFVGLANNVEIQNASADGLRKTLLHQANQFQQEFLSDNPDDPKSQLEYARSLNALAEINLLLGNARNAAGLAESSLDYFEKAERKITLSADEKSNAALLLGRSYTQAGEFKKADEAFDTSLDLIRDRLARDGNDTLPVHQMARLASAFTNRAFALHFQDRLDEAFTDIQVAKDLWSALDQLSVTQAIDQHSLPMDRGLFDYVSAENQRLNRNYYAAVTSYEQAILNLGIASRFAEQTASANFLTAKCLRGLGLTHAMQKNTDTAIENYEGAIELLDPLVAVHPLIEVYSSLLSQIRYSLATSYMVAGELDVAEKLILTNIAEKKELIRNFPDSGSKYYSFLGDSYNIHYIILYRAKKIDDAQGEKLLSETIVAFETSIALNPDWKRPKMAVARTHTNLGFLYSRSLKLDSAEQMYRKSRVVVDELLRSEPNWSEAIDAYYGATMNWISLEINRNESESAIDLLDALVERFPDHPRNRKTLLGKPGLLVQAGRIDDARIELLDYVDRPPSGPEHHIEAAERAIKLSEMDEITSDPDMVEMFEDLAMELIDLGTPSDAKLAESYLESIRSSKSLSRFVDSDR